MMQKKTSFKGNVAIKLSYLVLVVSLLNGLSPYVLSATSRINLAQILNLSTKLFDGYIWQLVTPSFIVPMTNAWSFALDIAFFTLLLYFITKSILERLHASQLLPFICISCCFINFSTALALKYLAPAQMCTTYLGCSLSLLMLWTCIDAQKRIALFLVFSVSTKTFFLCFFFLVSLQALTQNDYVALLSYTLSSIFAYIYSIAKLQLSSPFRGLSKIDNGIKKIYFTLVSTYRWKALPFIHKAISPIAHTLRKLKHIEDTFVDKTLEKISNKGTQSLSIGERLGLYLVSCKKKKNFK